MLILLFSIFFHSHVLFAVPWNDGIGGNNTLPLPEPSLYVFGDSNFQAGPKSSGHDSWMQANYYPYGESCFFLEKNRFTNGKVIPELIGISLGAGVASFDDDRFPESKSNFASASAGILPQTGTAFGKNLCFEKQISLFKELVQGEVKARYKTQENLSKFLAMSVYLINIGSSDYIHNYLQPNNYNTSNHYNGEEFAELLIKEYSNYIKDLYNLGARKMVLFQIGPLGCFPYMIEKFKPRSRCAENINDLVSKFNNKLDVKLKELQKELGGSQLVTGRVYSLIKNMIETPANYGFEETRWPCCPIAKNGRGLCERTVFEVGSKKGREKSQPSTEERYWSGQVKYLCQDIPMPESLKRSKKWTGPNKDETCVDKSIYVFFDELHLTQAANRIIAEQCLARTGGTCSPLGIKQLMFA